MNFGEAMAYWYLRLNGFFPLHNFVLHRRTEKDEAATDDAHSADVDVLAVRFPHVYEEVGGQPCDWDPALFEPLKADGQVIVVIAEVKTSGNVGPREVKRSFCASRLLSAIRRTGIVPPEEAPSLAELFASRKTVWSSVCAVRSSYEGAVLAKVLFAPVKVRGPWFNITLEQVECFITGRMRQYADPKRGDRFFFPDPLAQYWAWRARV